MIDIHCHILPGIDDGSPNVAVSLQLLQEQERQGIDTVVATPHFYAHRRSPQEFLERRERAWEQLSAAAPLRQEIRLGAEVYYFSGISRMEELPQLKIGGSRLLLLEMPFHTWTDYTVREVLEMSRATEYRLLIAHIERYYFKQKVSVWDGFLEENILMQSNAEFFLSLRTRYFALKLLREGRIHLLATDCHNMDRRPPNMEEARKVIRRRCGDGPLDEMDALGRKLLGL